MVFPPEGFPSSQKMSTTAGLGCFGQRETAVSAFLDYPPECCVLSAARSKSAPALPLSCELCSQKKHYHILFSPVELDTDMFLVHDVRLSYL